MVNNQRHSVSVAGFTLVELLTVIAIIGILVGMIFPAVAAVRNAARANSCLNNIRQIQMAVLNYESAHRHLPTAGAEWHWLDINASEYPKSFSNPVAGSFLTSILPYMNQRGPSERLIEELVSSPEESLAERLEELSDYDIPTFHCPASNPSFRLTNSEVVIGSDRHSGEYTSHYYGIAGPIGQGRSLDNPPRIYPTDSTNYAELMFDASGAAGVGAGTAPSGGRVSLEGVYAPNLQGTFSGRLAIDSEDILDGTSNTLAIGEIARSKGSKGIDDPILVGWAFGALYSGTIEDPRLRNTYSSKSLVHRINIVGTSTDPVNDKVNETPFTSNHGAGAQFALADGSVRFITESVNVDILKIWTTTNVREKTSTDDLSGT